MNLKAKRILKWIRNVIIFFFAFSLLQVIAFKFIPVYYTPFMLFNNVKQLISGQTVVCEHKWVSIDQVSAYLIQAVVASEDNLFLKHSGFDFTQIEIAQKEAEDGKRFRGASTITQQTAKNVFLWQGKSYLRKGLEAYYTVLIEFIWGKERIMEVYLNSIEMGENIYGAEALSQMNFKKSAKKLTPAEAALIAATLPNPIKFNSARPSKYMRKRQAKIEDLMWKIGPVDFNKKEQPEKKGNKKSKQNK